MPSLLLAMLILSVCTQSANAQEGVGSRREQRIEIEFSSARRPAIVEPDSGVITFYVQINGVRARALLDSGSDQSIISESFVNALELEQEPSTIPLRTFDGRLIDTTIVAGINFLVPGQIRARTDMVVMDLSGLSSAMEAPIDVIIGGDFVNGLAWSYTSSLNEILFEMPGVAPPDGYAEIEVVHGESVDIPLNGVPFRLKLDTGQSSSVSLVNSAWDRIVPSAERVTNGKMRNTAGDLIDVRIAHGVSMALAERSVVIDVSTTQARRCGDCVGALGWGAFDGRDVKFDIPSGRIWIK